MITPNNIVIPKLSAFVDGVPIESGVWDQVKRLSDMPFVSNLALMPDAHVGHGSTVGSVIGTSRAIIPAAVGVDIGCGMEAVNLGIKADRLPDSLASLRADIESFIPVGGPGVKGSWDEQRFQRVPDPVRIMWDGFSARFDKILDKYPQISSRMHPESQLGTLGTGNHFIELCVDKDQNVWVMLHSGSRGLGNRIGSFFIEKAREEMRRWFINLPDQDLAYLPEGSQFYQDYIDAVSLAQKFASASRRLMLNTVLDVVDRAVGGILAPDLTEHAISCHHNYISKEHHFHKDIWVTRKGAVRVRKGELGIIPGSMGAKSYIVRGLGNEKALDSCSHGAGRVMSRTEAKRRISVEDHIKATAGVECRKDSEVVDESPAAYKDIDAVIAAQKDQIEVVAEIKQILCIKG